MRDCLIAPFFRSRSMRISIPFSRSVRAHLWFVCVPMMHLQNALSSTSERSLQESQSFAIQSNTPAAHARLVEMFTEADVALHVGCSARTPSEIQWMVTRTIWTCPDRPVTPVGAAGPHHTPPCWSHLDSRYGLHPLEKSRACCAAFHRTILRGQLVGIERKETALEKRSSRAIEVARLKMNHSP